MKVSSAHARIMRSATAQPEEGNALARKMRNRCAMDEKKMLNIEKGCPCGQPDQSEKALRLLQ